MYVDTLKGPLFLLIYLLPYHACGWKLSRGRKKSILYRNGNICTFTGNFHSGKMKVCKFQLLVQFTRYMSFVDEMVKFYISAKETTSMISILENILTYMLKTYI